MTLLVVGGLSESVLSRPVWIGTYVGAGLVSEIVAYTVLPDQGFAGNSVAVLALAGAVAVVTAIEGNLAMRTLAGVSLAAGVALLASAILHGVGFVGGALVRGAKRWWRARAASAAR